ncbi:MAG: hypothetical protein QM766_11275 [Burkholderiaceae bacterium]
MRTGTASARFKGAMKAILAAGALASLGACAVVPAGPPVYGYGGGYVGPAVVAPAPVVVPSASIYFGRSWGGPRPGWGGPRGPYPYHGWGGGPRRW